MSNADSLCDASSRALAGTVVDCDFTTATRVRVVLIDDLPTAFVDLETTGASARGNAITEIAIVRVTSDGQVDEWSSLIHPGREIPLTISALTGIYDDMVASAPPFEDVAMHIRSLLADHLFVAHNVRFDFGFLRAAFRSLELPFRPRKLCTVQLSRQLYPQHRRHSLDALMQRHALTCEPRHRALTDARALHEWCVKAAAELGSEVVKEAASAQLAGPALPSGIDRATIRRLPESPGIYRFYGEDNVLLYVGKSVNVRGRVLAHFGAAGREERERKLFDQTQHVDAVATAGEMGALLLEAITIKTASPLLNRRLRHRAAVYTLALAPTDDYLVPHIAEVDGEAAPQDCYGLYRQRKGARRALDALAEDHRLCRKKLGMERGAGSCFGFQVGRCAGACTGKQPAVAWNLALLEALGPARVSDWPYDGTVALGEARGKQREWHVVDRWCYLGTASQRPDIHEHVDNERVFDLDIYKILRRFVLDPKSSLRVEPLGSR